MARQGVCSLESHRSGPPRLHGVPFAHVDRRHLRAGRRRLQRGGERAALEVASAVPGCAVPRAAAFRAPSSVDPPSHGRGCGRTTGWGCAPRGHPKKLGRSVFPRCETKRRICPRTEANTRVAGCLTREPPATPDPRHRDPRLVCRLPRRVGDQRRPACDGCGARGRARHAAVDR
ncbi:hypothetical protein ACFPRL_08555 [Pseudoclavibacter helvolus]